MILLGIAVLAVLLLVTIGLLVRREVRLRRSVTRDRPATLEGGGSHLTVRKDG